MQHVITSMCRQQAIQLGSAYEVRGTQFLLVEQQSEEAGETPIDAANSVLTPIFFI